MFNLIYMIRMPESQVLDVRHYLLLKMIILVFGHYATFKKFGTGEYTIYFFSLEKCCNLIYRGKRVCLEECKKLMPLHLNEMTVVQMNNLHHVFPSASSQLRPTFLQVIRV